MLTDHAWKLKYTPEDGDLVKRFYLPALEDAARYDRLTGYFRASALALAARGIEGLVRNEGHMRLVVGCTLDQDEIKAIEKGEALREQVEKHMADMAARRTRCRYRRGARTAVVDGLAGIPRGEGGGAVRQRRETRRGQLALPREDRDHRRPRRRQDRLDGKPERDRRGLEAQLGRRSTSTGSWSADAERVEAEEANFARLWANRPASVIVIDVPEAARRDLMRFMPNEGLPARLKQKKTEDTPEGKSGSTTTKPAPEPPAPVIDRRSLIWSFIKAAPTLPGGGALVGEATAAVTPWPHQVRAFEKLYGSWPPKLLIADEVGLGKTIEAGMLLRQAWLSGRAKRILVLAPKAVLSQWQIELREKFNLNWPIYDGRKLVRYPSPALRGTHERAVDRDRWHEEPVVIASSHLMRRSERAAALLADTAPWDLVVLDEAHHARRGSPGAVKEGPANALLRLMQGLRERTEGLVLLTATPMQVHPVEVWDLLTLLGLPSEWTAQAFIRFFEDLNHPNPSVEAMERMARLFQAVEREYGELTADAAMRLTKLRKLKVNRIMRALRDDASIPRRRMETDERRAAIAIMRAHTPVRHLVSRHTRKLLRRYAEAGMLKTSIAKRDVRDEFIEMSETERDLYKAVEGYISESYNKAAPTEKAAVGFVMTTYRRRLASSIHALRATLERHLGSITHGTALDVGRLEEDVPDDETADEAPDTEDLAELEREGLALEERGEIALLLEQTRRCPPDSKLVTLKDTISAARESGYEQVMVFTQYGDTMDFLRDELRKDTTVRLLCYSGRGGEVPAEGRAWRTITREEAKRRFRLGEADILLCTDAAAEGLNFQFCGGLVNYDMPWNPMRVEQRIGRIDRLGQRHEIVRVVNLHYEDTVETDVYKALGSRIKGFEGVVGPLQPILSQLPRTITAAVLAGGDEGHTARKNVIERIERQIDESESAAFDIDRVLDEDLTMPERPAPLVTMNDLDRVIASPELMAPGTQVRPLRPREYALRAPGMNEEVRVTTDPDYYEEHAESVELWSPGNPTFTPPDQLAQTDSPATGKTLEHILTMDP